MFYAWIIFGPTASGKTSLAVELARQKGAAILSFDSRQLYVGMAIGTGRDQPADYGFDLARPDEPYSINHYYRYCQPIIAAHRKSGQPLVLVGGSWPYAQVLIDPPQTLLAPVDEPLRAELAKLSTGQLQQRLQAADPKKYAALNPSDRSNPRRLLRAIEVAGLAQDQAVEPPLRPGEYELILHSIPFEQIETNIRRRIDDRLASGVLEETRQLMAAFADWSGPAFSATGYRFLRQVLEGQSTLEVAKELWFKQERGYAKRQLTWLKKLAGEKRYNIGTL